MAWKDERVQPWKQACLTVDILLEAGGHLRESPGAWLSLIAYHGSWQPTFRHFLLWLLKGFELQMPLLKESAANHFLWPGAKLCRTEVRHLNVGSQEPAQRWSRGEGTPATMGRVLVSQPQDLYRIKLAWIPAQMKGRCVFKALPLTLSCEREIHFFFFFWGCSHWQISHVLLCILAALIRCWREGGKQKEERERKRNNIEAGRQNFGATLGDVGEENGRWIWSYFIEHMCGTQLRDGLQGHSHLPQKCI